MPSDDLDNLDGDSLRIQPVIKALIRFDTKVSDELAQISARAQKAEEELESYRNKAAETEKLVAEAWKRAEEITTTASRTAAELLADGARQIESERRQLEAERLDVQRRERELVGALRDYLQEIETAQATLLRVARRAISTAMAGVEEAESEHANVAVLDGHSPPQAAVSASAEPKKTRPGQLTLSATTNEHRVIDQRNEIDLERLNGGGPLFRVISKRRQVGFS